MSDQDLRPFPIQHRTLKSIPWGLIASHEAQARANHDQTLQRLAERGGLSPLEAVRVLNDQSFRGPSFNMPKDRKSYDEAEAAAVKELEAAVTEYIDPDNWLVLSLKWSQGNEDLVWYKPHAQGYTVDLNKAGRFTRADADRVDRECEGVVMAVPEAAALALARSYLLVEAGEANVEALKRAAAEAKKG